ncbi:MAG TPA: amidohydrolase family protein [Rhodothermales bacterium]|nr:amidohydrolase family protein [Rhodothermales bacterium]
MVDQAEHSAMLHPNQTPAAMYVPRFLLVTCLLLTSVVLASAQVVAIRAGHVIDVAAGSALDNQVILIEDGVITAVGSDVTVPSGADVIDLSDAWVMPGMIDTHTHLTLTTMPGADINDFGSYYLTTLLEPTAFRALQGVTQARSLLESGFTWIRDVGNNAIYADVEIRRAIEGGWIPGPNVIASGRIISPFGGQFQLQPEKPELANPEYFFADSEDEIRRAVRENIHYGATVIKLVTDNQPYIYSVEDIRAAVEEAGDVGIKVAAHAYSDEAIRNSVLAGVASIEHGNNPSDETLGLMREHGTYLVGTDFPASRSGQERFELILERNRRALAAGAPMAFGSDVVYSREGSTRGELTLEFLESFTGADFPNDFILKMFTMNAADLLGVNSGQIKEGLAADIIAMDENPLDDVTALRAVHFVMKDGRVYKQGGEFMWETPRHMNNPRRKPGRRVVD